MLGIHCLPMKLNHSSDFSHQKIPAQLLIPDLLLQITDTLFSLSLSYLVSLPSSLCLENFFMKAGYGRSHELFELYHEESHNGSKIWHGGCLYDQMKKFRNFGRSHRFFGGGALFQ